jgi:hypothetical protein
MEAFLFRLVFNLKKSFGFIPSKLPMWAALCAGRADGSNPEFAARAKHAILVVVRARKSDVESSVYALLQSNGWREPEIEKLKLLIEPFHGDDPMLRACYESAAKDGGNFVVYTDPIIEA